MPQNQQLRLSPDGKWQALIRNYNIHVRPAPAADGASEVAGQTRAEPQEQAAPPQGFMLSADGSEGDAYTLNSIRWCFGTNSLRRNWHGASTMREDLDSTGASLVADSVDGAATSEASWPGSTFVPPRGRSPVSLKGMPSGRKTSPESA